MKCIQKYVRKWYTVNCKKAYPIGCAFLFEVKNMNLKMIPVNELKAYGNNPRNNSKAVKLVANSIKEFGFKVPLVIDKDNVIVCGHTRLLACKKLNINKVPCIIADDLTEKQLQAFRLADNKVSEKSTWDFKLLEQEMNDLADSFNMSDFGFDFDVSEKRQQNKNQEMKTVKTYHMMEFDPERCEGRYQMPTLEPCSVNVKRWIGFNYAKSTVDPFSGIHFYLDDYQFERVWASPERYIDILSNFAAVMTPSYSVYMDMAEPVRIWNVFRSRLLGQMMQDAGLRVIPIVYWADEKSFEYCFDGLPERSMLSTYAVGLKDPDVFKYWKAGMNELIKRKKPKTLLLYGNGTVPDYDFGKIKVIPIKNEVTERMKSL